MSPGPLPGALDLAHGRSRALASLLQVSWYHLHGDLANFSLAIPLANVTRARDLSRLLAKNPSSSSPVQSSF